MAIQSSEFRQKEKIEIHIYSSAREASSLLAEEIAVLIRKRQSEEKPVVLGLATGSSPTRLYRELIRLHKEEGLSFQNVHTFNLDEYYGLPRDHTESYWYFMQEQLFKHIDLPAENINIPDGLVKRSDVFNSCQDFEKKIRDLGGIDLQILGIGRTGHIGFNEPGSPVDSRTRLVTLDSLTRKDAARDFLGESNVPYYAITMGVGTILDARKIVLLAWGQGKSEMVARSVEGPADEKIAASLLQKHKDVRFMLDEPAASQLTRIKYPWLVGPVEWTTPNARRAVCWLSREVKRPILKLQDENYSEHGMAELLTEQGPAYDLNIKIFNIVQHTITGWPGGKPNADDSNRPERSNPYPKRILVFSPEPSDDVLGMGGTLARLQDQGHLVEVVYMTSGNLAVSDEEALMASDLMMELSDSSDAPSIAMEVKAALSSGDNKSSNDAVRRLKGLIRRGEARAALRIAGLSSGKEHFLDLPFYERGRYRQFFPSSGDFEIVTNLLREKQPHQVFFTGEGLDPSAVGAHCCALIKAAIDSEMDSPWMIDCRFWVYQSPDKDWPIHDIDMAVPMSPAQLSQKIQAIYQHKSQRGQTPAVAQDLHEAWQIAQTTARQLAAYYDDLGLAEYEAIEAFRRFIP